jgi:organic hydroperoxide reductase OsmC/OhrA
MLQRYTLKHSKDEGGWAVKDQEGSVIATFKTKAEATSGGRLQKAIGGSGTVRIHTEDGAFEEERTFPREDDPRRSPG